jgi:hypothetical protein
LTVAAKSLAARTRQLLQSVGALPAFSPSPRGRASALVGGITVGLLWEATRHILLWYFTTLSVVGVVYGSLATTIVGLLSLEVASIFLLLGTQVIAELRACRRRRHGGTRRTQDGGRTRRAAVTRQQILVVDSHAPIRSGLVIVVNARLVGTVTPSGGVGERERGRALQLFPCQTHHVASLARVVL